MADHPPFLDHYSAGEDSYYESLRHPEEKMDQLRREDKTAFHAATGRKTETAKVLDPLDGFEIHSCSKKFGPWVRVELDAERDYLAVQLSDDSPLGPFLQIVHCPPTYANADKVGAHFQAFLNGISSIATAKKAA